MIPAHRIEMIGDWAGQLEKLDPRKWAEVLNEELSQGVYLGASVIEGKAKKGVARGRSSWPKKHPWTIPIRRSEGESGRGRMRVSGSLMNAINVRHDGLVAYVGLFRGEAWTNERGDYANVGWQLEHGYYINVTPRMRGWLAARGLFLRQGTKVIRIRAWPFLAPAVTQSKKEVKEILEAAIRRALHRIRAS